MVHHSTSGRIRIFVSRIFVICLLTVVLFSESRWKGHQIIIGTFLFAVGYVMAGIALIGRLWCSLYISGYKNNTLITTGPYSISRNPLYFFSLIGSIGLGLATETLLIPLVILIVFLIYYPGIIRNEEQRLLAIHGEKLELYRHKTPAFFPKLSLYEEPQTYVVNPKIFRKSMYSALWFVWFLAILEIIEVLHETGALPIYFKIY